jgi:hypothetical protein
MSKQSHVLLKCPGPFFDFGVQKAVVVFPALLWVAVYLVKIFVLDVKFLGNGVPFIS